MLGIRRRKEVLWWLPEKDMEYGPEDIEKHYLQRRERYLEELKASMRSSLVLVGGRPLCFSGTLGQACMELAQEDMRRERGR